MDLEDEMKLTQKEFKAEKSYQGLMHLLKRALREKTLTVDEYRTASMEYAQRLSPKTRILLSLRGVMLRGGQKS